MVLLHHVRYITKAQAIAFCIVHIAMRHTEEFFENAMVIFLRNTNAIIGNHEFNAGADIPDPDLNVRGLAAVF